MNPGARSIVLTESQAACLVALRLRKESKTEIAIQAKLDLKKAAMALDALKELGLAGRGEMNSWHPTGGEGIVDLRQFRIEFGVVAHFLALALGVCSMF